MSTSSTRDCKDDAFGVKRFLLTRLFPGKGAMVQGSEKFRFDNFGQFGQLPRPRAGATPDIGGSLVGEKLEVKGHFAELPHYS
jgi:hypothetical protein